MKPYADTSLLFSLYSTDANSTKADAWRMANPRCLLAVEIEFSGSPKRILGDFTNASMMGLVGLVIGPSGKFMQQILRVAEYVRTLRKLGKAPEHLFTNVACMDESEFKALFNGL